MPSAGSQPQPCACDWGGECQEILAQEPCDKKTPSASLILWGPSPASPAGHYPFSDSKPQHGMPIPRANTTDALKWKGCSNICIWEGEKLGRKNPMVKWFLPCSEFLPSWESAVLTHTHFIPCENSNIWAYLAAGKEGTETFALFEKHNLEARQRDWIKTKDLLLSSTEEHDTEELHIGFIHTKREPFIYTSVQSHQWYLTTTLCFPCFLLLVIPT